MTLPFWIAVVVAAGFAVAWLMDRMMYLHDRAQAAALAARFHDLGTLCQSRTLGDGACRDPACRAAWEEFAKRCADPVFAFAEAEAAASAGRPLK